MRSLSDFNRWFPIGVLLSVLACAGAPPSRIGTGMAVLEGQLVVTGNVPEERRITLVEDGGTAWRLESAPLEGELLNLADHRLRVWGVPGGTREEGEEISLLLSRYELLPIDGVSPLIGTLRVDGALMMFSARESGGRYLLTGPLSDVLSCYDGFEAWIWGVKADVWECGDEACLDVRGYVILGPGATRAAPADTLHNSGSG